MAGQFWTLTHYFPLEIVMLALCIAYNCALFSIKSVPKLLTLTLQGVTTNKLQCEHLQVSVGSSLQTGMRVHWIMPTATQQKAISIRLE